MTFCVPVFFTDSLTGNYIFENDCNLELTKSAGTVSYALAMTLFVFIPMLAMPYFHVHISYSICQSRRRVENIIPQRRTSSVTIQVKLMLSACYLGFQICFLPYSVVSLVDLFSTQPIPSEIWRCCTYIMYIHSIINFIVYGIFNAQFRAAYKTLLRVSCKYCTCVSCPCKQVNTINIHINVQHVYKSRSRSPVKTINK